MAGYFCKNAITFTRFLKGHIIYFLLFLQIFDHYIKRQHEILRLNGFHSFYRETHNHKNVPFHIVNLWTVTYLAVQTLMHQYYADNFFTKCVVVQFLSPVVYSTMFAVTETLMLAITHGTYLTKVVRFNRTKPLPDALRGTQSSGEGLVGLTQRNASYMDLLEKQADMINYLKDHNLRLNQKLMQLNSQVRTVTLPPQI